MDATEIDISETVAPTFTSLPPVVPPWEKKKAWGYWAPLVREYHNVIDNPNRLPTVLHPLISKERAFTFGASQPSYINLEVHATDEYNVHRRLFINVCQENFLVGAIGSVLVGIGTNHFNLSKSSLHSFMAQRLILGKPVAAVTRMALSASIITATLCAKVATRAVAGGVLYDVLKRSREQKRMDTTIKVQNAGLAGLATGLLFGLRGGLPTAWAAGILTCVGAMASEFVDMPIMFPTNRQE